MSSAICFNLVYSKILLSGKGLTKIQNIIFLKVILTRIRNKVVDSVNPRTV